MFFGQYEHAIDDKSRITLPARFRDALADGVVLSKGLDGSVDVYPPGAVGDDGRRPHRRARPAAARHAGCCSAHFFGGASEDVPDKQGRVHLPAPLVAHGKLGKDVTLIGSNDHLEIWDRSLWAERLEGIEGSADNVAQRLAEQRV